MDAPTSAQLPWRALGRLPLVERALLAVLGVLLLPALALALPDFAPVPVQLDFVSYYLAARAIAAGRSPYDPVALAELAAAQTALPATPFPYLYPPPLAVLLLPLAALPFGAANLLWLALNLLWLVLAAACVVRLAPRPRPPLWAAIAIALLAPGVQITLWLGQVNLLLLLLIAGAILAAGRDSPGPGRDALAGVLLALGAAIKLFPAALVLVFLARGRVRVVAAFAVGLLTVALIGVVRAGGPATTAEWALTVLPRYAGGFESIENQSLPAAVARLFSPTPLRPALIPGRPAALTVPPLLDNAGLGRALGYTLAGCVIVATLWVLGRRWARERSPVTPHTEPALVLVAALLAMPLVWYHYYPLLLVAYAAGANAARNDRITRLLLLLGAVLIALQRYWRVSAHLGTPLALSFGALGVGLLWAALARAVARGEGGR